MRSAFALRINSGKNIFNFGIAERLRTLRYSIFTGGVVKGNGICSACFLRKRGAAGKLLLGASGLNPLRHRYAMTPPPRGGGFALLAGRCTKAPPSGELSPQVTERVRAPNKNSPCTVRCGGSLGSKGSYLFLYIS